MTAVSNRVRLLAAGAGIAALLAAAPATGASGDAEIAYDMGRAALAAGDTAEAERLFAKSCLADDGAADACLAWAGLTRSAGNEKDLKRALGSAVMLAPDDVEARYALALFLLEKRDYTWAIEHLEAAAKLAADERDRALLLYYLGYAQLKNGDAAKAADTLERARPGLDPALRTRCDFYSALAAESRGANGESFSMLEDAAAGDDPAYAAAARQRLASESAFFAGTGASAALGASLGVNTHPSSSFLDDPGADPVAVLQSVFRGDGTLSAGRYANAFQGAVTAYREQSWTALEPLSEDAVFAPEDFNATLFLGQMAYLRRGWIGRLEHELRLGLTGETQFLDHGPRRTSTGAFEPDPDPFGLVVWAAGARAWWSFAARPESVLGARLDAEVRPNLADEDRSAIRLRLRLAWERDLARDLVLRVFLGCRYDISYHDPAVVKYDRLLPEAEASLSYRTPWPRLALKAGALAKYGWYLNGRGDRNNSFRPAWQEDLSESEAEYYDLTRQDFEWEASAEAAVALWAKAALAITYKHHGRLSNIDDAPIAESAEPVEYGYDQDVVMLELRQRF